ncbi:phosphatidylglycerophosphatase A family protein [Halomonas sp. GFAJ-1]|uniref:phosphatidylglycerophosphatase A family protein n=1 Tax=Halomonas sp. GFAJ-1 TaxID=1118153 RepID=UPI00023A4240|nr:phosphatidylglycerophosphatase A [Halomonas sp. GFAJ-1]AVI62634.1 hypothetical protein BB497_07900 [Halomonas sp. GFAJ-1]EHK59862.1 phosphatidylglycerophosphatase A [Halomonas sp. GFAJ-1]
MNLAAFLKQSVGFEVYGGPGAVWLGSWARQAHQSTECVKCGLLWLATDFGLKLAPIALEPFGSLFRFFDALKPPPIHLAEYVQGGVGSVLDDVVAALATWVVVVLVLKLWQRRASQPVKATQLV